ncbi:hypothetical protein LZZ85_11295 [Terrimonas sp. NA20]|uniref:Uncharacterized protein n=1 Tax=Terrimonas ginsenosidimutans TaxID=2908004 RepID=A0ABS9KRC5_9BACT|nr:hypothetical protein [Terrimonas ginsenosidimutans]MCG2614873.1 hypothetical protein [Terrimonas ginsenosidimutans]
MKSKYSPGDLVVITDDMADVPAQTIGQLVKLVSQHPDRSSLWQYEYQGEVTGYINELEFKYPKPAAYYSVPPIEPEDPNVKISEYFYSVYKCRDLLRQVSEVPHSLSIFSNGEAGSLKAMLDRLDTRIEVLEELQHFLKQP